jgi:predicted regulator of Ras-like GTPase activity (Roadblock/LC7/MglB family)
MATTGSLREIPLAALIETGCRSRAAARLRLPPRDLEGKLFFLDGELVHAVCGERKGEPASWRLLCQTNGQCVLEDEVRSPERTLHRPWQALLLEGMQRAAAPETAGPRSLPPGEMVSRLKAIEGVMGVVVAGPDGVVLAADVPEGKGEAEGALTVYLDAAAETLAGFLPMGAFEHAVVAEPQRRLLIFRHPPFIVGLVLSPQASPALVLAELPGRLS